MPAPSRAQEPPWVCAEEEDENEVSEGESEDEEGPSMSALAVPRSGVQTRQSLRFLAWRPRMCRWILARTRMRQRFPSALQNPLRSRSVSISLVLN